MQNSTDTIDYGNLFMNLPTPHIVVRPDEALTIIAQNEAHAKITLSQHRQVIGKPLLEAFPDTTPTYHATGVSKLAQSFRKVARTKKPDIMPVMQYNLTDKNGNSVERWWRAKHYPLFNEAGEVALIYQVTEDVTDEFKDQQQAAQLSSQMSSALDIGLISTWSWDMKNDVVIGDKNLARSFGVGTKRAREGLPLQVFIDLIHPHDRQRIADSISKSVNSNTAYSEEYRTVMPNGKLHWVKARGKVQNDSDGNPTFFTGVLIDITDQKQAELKLAQSERQYNALFNSTIVAIAMATTNGDILQANKTFLRMFGYSKAELKKGIASAHITFYREDAATKHIYETLIAKGEAEPVRKEYKRKDGSRFTGLVGAAMLPGSTDTFIAFIVDVTENEKLKELSRAKDDFVALASHQLRSPATTVKQYIGVLLNEMAGPLNEDQLQYLTTANNANNRQLTIIDDLLKTAQIDTHGFSVVLQPTNLVKIVKEVIDEYESVFDTRRQKIKFDCSVDIIIVRADQAELKTAIANLLENASKYSPAGKSISVSLVYEEESAILTIVDQGVGIAKENYDKIFDKFTRIYNELSDTVSGSGLGLYWVKRIVEIHGGKVIIKSKLGKGTTVVVKLPI